MSHRYGHSKHLSTIVFDRNQLTKVLNNRIKIMEGWNNERIYDHILFILAALTTCLRVASRYIKRNILRAAVYLLFSLIGVAGIISGCSTNMNS